MKSILGSLSRKYKELSAAAEERRAPTFGAFLLKRQHALLDGATAVTKQLAWISFLALAGCATSLTYSQWKPGMEVQSTALRFKLQASTITLNAPSPRSKQANGSAKDSQDSASAQHCPKDVASKDWWECFKAVVAQSAPVGSMRKTTSKTMPGPIWVAKPSDVRNLFLTTTSISGAPVTGQEGLYSAITVKFSSNVGTVIAGAGSGAAVGFEIGGPHAAAVGLALGAIGNLPYVEYSSLIATTYPFLDYLCANPSVDLSDAGSNKALRSPAITFPIAFKVGDLTKIAPMTELAAAHRPDASGEDNANDCWHALPNTTSLAVPPSLGETASSARQPTSGDGWLYRLVATDWDPKNPGKLLDGAIPVKTFFSTPAYYSEGFPYSSCRNITLQITWWNELNTSIKDAKGGKAAHPKVESFNLRVADPRYVDIAYLHKGGAINFNSDCGATVSMDVDTSSSAALNAIVTQTEAILKAEQAWDSAQKKSQ